MHWYRKCYRIVGGLNLTITCYYSRLCHTSVSITMVQHRNVHRAGKAHNLEALYFQTRCFSFEDSCYTKARLETGGIILASP